MLVTNQIKSNFLFKNLLPDSNQKLSGSESSSLPTELYKFLHTEKSETLPGELFMFRHQINSKFTLRHSCLGAKINMFGAKLTVAISTGLAAKQQNNCSVTCPLEGRKGKRMKDSWVEVETDLIKQ